MLTLVRLLPVSLLGMGGCYLVPGTPAPFPSFYLQLVMLLKSRLYFFGDVISDLYYRRHNVRDGTGMSDYAIYFRKRGCSTDSFVLDFAVVSFLVQ